VPLLLVVPVPRPLLPAQDRLMLPPWPLLVLSGLLLPALPLLLLSMFWLHGQRVLLLLHWRQWVHWSVRCLLPLYWQDLLLLHGRV
jgi:hypothetical protein